MDVDRVLSSLDRSLPAGAAASWFDAGAAAPDGPRRAPSGPVRDLVAGLTAVLDRAEGLGDGTALLVETAAQTVLVHHAGAAGALVVEAGRGLNLALVRRAVALALDGVEEEAEPAAAEPVRLPARRGGIATAFPRRTPPPSVTDFNFVPEDTEVLRMLEQALST